MQRRPRDGRAGKRGQRSGAPGRGPDAPGSSLLVEREPEHRVLLGSSAHVCADHEPRRVAVDRHRRPGQVGRGEHAVLTANPIAQGQVDTTHHASRIDRHRDGATGRDRRVDDRRPMR